MQDVIAEFERTIEASYDQLAKFTEAESAEPRSIGKWSRKQIIGHLIDSASNNHQRFVRAQLADNISLPGYEQEAWNKCQQYQSESWANLLQLWKSYNTHLLHIVSHIPEDKLDNLCTVGNNEPVTLRFLAGDYVEHMKKHLGQA